MFINAVGEYAEKESPVREISKQFKQLMEDGDFEAVYNEMETTNHIKDILNGIQ